MMHTERFMMERKILNNVTQATADWYKYSLKAFQPILEAVAQRAAVIVHIGEFRQNAGHYVPRLEMRREVAGDLRAIFELTGW